MSRDPKSEYYDVGGIETLDILKAKLTPEQYRGYLLGNVIKYACRMNFKGCAERDAEKLAVYSAELAAIAYKQGGEFMTIQRYELLDLSTADGPSAMVTESEEGTYVLHADHVAEVAALKEEIAAVRQALDGYDNHAEPVAELVKAMRHRHDDYVESICELKARVAELGDLGQLKGDNRHIEGIEWKPQGDANEYALVRGNQWVAHIRMNGELTVPAQEAILGAMLEKRS